MIKNNKKLSIIIPVYNLEDYISKCLDTIINQIDECIEIIIVNDGSTDNTEEVCKKYCEKYSFIKYFYQENSGVSSARNLGLEYASGEFVWFIDGDDWIIDGSVNRILLELKDQYDIILGDFVKSFDHKIKNNVKNNVELKQNINAMSYPQNFINLFKYKLCNLALWSNIMRKDLFYQNNIKLDTSIKYTEDMDCMLELLLSTKKIKILIEPIYVYRQDRQESVTNNYTSKRVQDTMCLVNKWYNRISNSKLENEIKKYIIDFIRYEYFIALGTATLLPKKEKRKLLNSLREYKFFFKNAYGKKEKIVRIVYRVLGFNITCTLMGFWIRNKNRIKM